MRRLSFLIGAVLALVSGAASAQYTGNMPSGTVLGNNQSTPRPAVPIYLGSSSIDARNYGVKADGVTSDDVAMKAATDACSAGSGHKLILPSSSILLTGAAQITLNHCHIEGAGVGPAGGAVHGTTFLLTSTTVTPFVFGDGGIGITGVNFYWPNQTTGTTVYPALFTDTSAGASEMYWDHVNILNAYDGFAQSATSGGLGRWYITNSNLYAVHDLFKIGSVGDYIYFNNIAFNQGSWQQVNGTASWWNATITNVAQANTIFRIIPSTTGTAAAMTVSNSNAFAWGNGIVMSGVL